MVHRAWLSSHVTDQASCSSSSHRQMNEHQIMYVLAINGVSSTWYKEWLSIRNVADQWAAWRGCSGECRCLVLDEWHTCRTWYVSLYSSEQPPFFIHHPSLFSPLLPFLYKHVLCIWRDIRKTINILLVRLEHHYFRQNKKPTTTTAVRAHIKNQQWQPFQ